MHIKTVFLILMLIPITVQGSQTGLKQLNELVPCWMKKNIRPLAIVAIGIGILVRLRKSTQSQPAILPTTPQPNTQSPAHRPSPQLSAHEPDQAATRIASLESDQDGVEGELIDEEEEEITTDTELALPPDILEQQQALNNAITGKETIGQRCGVVTGAGGATALMLLYHQNIPEQIAKNLRNRPPTRTGLELGAVLSGAGSVLSPFVQPMGCLLLVAFCWSRFKSMILEPYKLKHQQELERFTELLNRHKKDTAKEIADSLKAQNIAISKSADEVEKLKKAQDAAEQSLKKALDAAQQTANRQLALVLADQSEQNKRLREKFQEEHNDSLAKVAELMQGHGTDLAAIKESHETLAETNRQLKAKVDAIIPAMGQLMESTRRLRESSEQTRQLATRSLGAGAGPGPGNRLIKGPGTEKKRG